METPDYVERQRHGNRRPSMLELWPKKTSISVEHMVGPDEEDHWFKSSLGNLGFRQIVSCLEWWNGVKEPPRSGMLHGIVSSQWFDVLTAFIIFLNSASTAALSDWELKHVGSELPTFFMVIELAFIAYYLIEFLLKLSVHKHYFFCNDDMAWNWFDLVVLAFSLFDQFTVYFYKNGPSNNLSFARSFRIFRIARILRMFRLIHMLRELRTMMESILGSFVSLFWSFVMIGLILYIFALMFCQAVASRLSIGVDEEYERELYYYFGSVRGTTLTLYECTTGGVDWHDVYKVIRKLGLMHTTFFLFYITFWTFAVVNILTGIFVDSAMRIAAPDRDAEILQQRRKDTADSEELKAIMREALLVPEEVGDAFLISKELFAVTLKNPKIHGYLATLGLDVKDVDLFFDTLAANSGEKEMRIDEFVAHAIRMKGLASSIDVQGLAIQMRMLRNQVDTLQKCTAPPPRSVGRTSLSSTVTAKSNCTPHGQLH